MNIGRTSLRLVPIVLLSRGAAFAVPIAIAMWFGADAVSDAWYWALSLPTFSLVLAGSALGTAAVPIMAEAQDDGELSDLLGTVLGWVGLLSLLAAVIFAFCAPTLLYWTSQFDLQTQELASTYCWLLVPFVGLTTLSASLKAACELKQLFVALTWTPVLRASAVILVTWLTLAPLGPMALPLGLVSGEALQCVFWIFLLQREGLKTMPKLSRPPQLIKLGRHVLWLLGGEALVALNIVVDKIFASRLDEGAVSILEYADRARVIPQTLLHASLAMVAFALWSKLWAKSEKNAAYQSMNHALHWVLALSAPVIAGMWIGRFVLCRLLFERGAFGASESTETAIVLGGYLVGIIPNLLAILLVRIHVLQRHFGLIFGLGMVSMLLNALLNHLLIDQYGLLGIALSTSLTVSVVTLCYGVRLPQTIRPHSWGVGWLSLLGSILTAAAVEYYAVPQQIWDLHLWFAALCCILILAWAVRHAPSPQSEAV